MKKVPLLLILSALFIAVAILAAVFLPARIGWHTDAANVTRTTEMRTLSLAGYYIFGDPQDDDRSVRIGTEPYEDYYIRTYALELWAIGGMLLLYGIMRLRRMRKHTSHTSSE